MTGAIGKLCNIIRRKLWSRVVGWHCCIEILYKKDILITLLLQMSSDVLFRVLPDHHIGPFCCRRGILYDEVTLESAYRSIAIWSSGLQTNFFLLKLERDFQAWGRVSVSVKVTRRTMAEQKSFSMTHDVLHVCLHDVQYELTLVASDSLNEKATTCLLYTSRCV